MLQTHDEAIKKLGEALGRFETQAASHFEASQGRLPSTPDELAAFISGLAATAAGGRGPISGLPESLAVSLASEFVFIHGQLPSDERKLALLHRLAHGIGAGLDSIAEAPGPRLHSMLLTEFARQTSGGTVGACSKAGRGSGSGGRVSK